MTKSSVGCWLLVVGAAAAFAAEPGPLLVPDYNRDGVVEDASLAAVGKPRVIIDTDLGSSMDDLFTVDLAARMHKQGKLDLMAVMMDRPDLSDQDGNGEFLTFADRYLASLGLGDLPIGKSMEPMESQWVFNPYWTLIYSNSVTGVGLLLPTNRTPEQVASLTNAVTLYRRLLEDAQPKSVVICSTGFLNNLKALMESAPNHGGDDIASSGLELIAAKVKELRIMGGCFDSNSAPVETGGVEYNFAGDPGAAKKVVEEWPTPVVVSPWEVGLKLEYQPDDVLADFPTGTFDPVVRAAYTYWPKPTGEEYMNRLWDPMTVLPLVDGDTLVPLSAKGGIAVDERGVTTFVHDPSSNRCYQVASNMNATAVLNRLREIYRTGNPSADTVVYGTIRTAEERNPVAEAIAIKDGKYIYVGDEVGVAAYLGKETQIVDHRGKGMVMPGCTDGHSHYVNTIAMGNMKGGILFDAEDDKETVLQKLSEATRKANDAGKKSLCGFGWYFGILGYDRPTLQELDEVTHGVSTVIFDSSGHHAFCNSECLRRCGIVDGEGNVLIKEIDGGVLELKNGYPTGYVNERVTGYLTRMGGIDADELIDEEVAEDAIRKAQGLLLSTGYTTALDGWSNQMHPGKFYEVAHRMDTNGTLKIVLPMTYEVEPWQTNMNEQIDYLASLNEKYRTAHVLPEYLKVFMDGVVETKTGAISKPYKDGTVYKSFWSVDRLADITGKCNAKGLTVHAHTMGDAAIRDVTDAYIQGGDGTHRNCLVHLRNVSTNEFNDFERIAANNIACTAGLTWHVSDLGFEAYLSGILEEEYVRHAYPIRSFFDAGVKVSSHSDYPANIPSPQDPFGMMQIAVTGLLPEPGETDYPFDTNELVTVGQAFQALTINGAWQLGLENERGSIAVGKWADFVLADLDVFECAATDIGKTKVVSTWFEGEKVYQFVPEPFPVPVIASFKPDFTQGPTTQVPNVSWKIDGPFDRVALTIDKTTVYEGDDRNGEGRWRDLRRPGTHRLKLTVGYGDEEVTSSCFYTALLEGEEPALMPMIGYFYPDYYVGKKGTAPLVHWDTKNITSFEIWLDGTCILMSQNASGEFRFSQLNTPGSYVVRMVAHNAIDDAEASFCYRCEAPAQDQLTSAPLLGSVDQPPVILTFEPDAYNASIRETPYIRWNLSAPVDALKLVIDEIPVFIGDGKEGSGRWLDVSGLNLGELTGSHEVSLSVSNSFGVVTSNFTCTCYWEAPPPPPLGSEENPWRIGEAVQAYTNGIGGLIIVGEGATSNYTDTASLPWAEVVGEITSVAVPDDVTVIGENLWAGLADGVVINGEAILRRRAIAVGFPGETPAGAISGAEFERIDIVDGKAYLGVAVYTNASLEVEKAGGGWGVATNGVIEVPAPGKQGFFYLMSKPSVP